MIEFYSFFLDDEEHGCRVWRSENNCLSDVHAVRWLNEEGNARRFAVLEWSGTEAGRERRGLRPHLEPRRHVIGIIPC
jgi:hypothetical protein